MKSLRDQSSCFTVHDKFFFLEKEALGIFDDESRVRLRALQAVKSKYYEVFMNLSVVVASFIIGLRDRNTEAFSSDFNVSIALANFAFTLIFMIDSILKMISFGLY